jgi:thiamine biosynthesis protein ThiS
MQVVINGKQRDFSTLSPTATITDLISALDLKDDRIALEHNGTIVRRNAWPTTAISPNDKFEIVHFVGGGAPVTRAAS